MAVFTPVTDEQVKEFLEGYDLGSLESVEGIKDGVSNTNYHLYTTSGHFILTLYEPKRVRPGDVPFFLGYAKHLEACGITSGSARANKMGALCSPLADKPAAVSIFLQGEGNTLETITPPLCYEAGKVLARMHRAGEKFDDECANRFGMGRWALWFEQTEERLDEIQDGLRALVDSELDSLHEKWPRKLPEGAIHGDFFPDNVFFVDGKVSGVIDFHFACTDFLAYDLAIAVNAWAFDSDAQFRSDCYDALLRGYKEVRPLSDDEKAAWPTLLRGAALRFLLSRCEEFLNYKEGDFMKPHDPLAYKKRLEFFRSEFEG